MDVYEFIATIILSSLLKDSRNSLYYLFYCAPSIGAIYRVRVPSAEGDIGVSSMSSSQYSIIWNICCDFYFIELIYKIRLVLDLFFCNTNKS